MNFDFSKGSLAEIGLTILFVFLVFGIFAWSLWAFASYAIGNIVDRWPNLNTKEKRNLIAKNVIYLAVFGVFVFLSLQKFSTLAGH